MADINLLKLAAADAAITALLDLISGYRAGTPLPTVTRFQQIWLELYPYVKSDPTFRLPSENSTVDGLYGWKTGKAMETFVLGAAYKLGQPLVWASKSADLLLPKRAADLPAWGVRNKTAMDAMRVWLYNLHNPKPVEVVTPAPSPVPSPTPKSAPAPTPPQQSKTVIMRMAPYQEDKTKLYVGVGLAIVGISAVYWFVLRKKKKKSRK